MLQTNIKEWRYLVFKSLLSQLSNYNLEEKKKTLNHLWVWIEIVKVSFKLIFQKYGICVQFYGCTLTKNILTIPQISFSFLSISPHFHITILWWLLIGCGVTIMADWVCFSPCEKRNQKIRGGLVWCAIGRFKLQTTKL